MPPNVLIPVDGLEIAITDARALRDHYQYCLEHGEMDRDNPVLGRTAAAVVQAAADGDEQVELDAGDATILADARDQQATHAIEARDPDLAETATRRAEAIIAELYDQEPEFHERMLTTSSVHIKYAPDGASTIPQELESTLGAPAELYDRGLNERIDELLAGIEGTRPKSAKLRGTLFCDSCNDSILPNSAIGMYLADIDLMNPDADRQLQLHRITCADCRPPRIRYPCRDVTELLLYGHVTQSYQFANLDLKQAAGRDEGFNWNPRETAEEIFGRPFETIFGITDTDGSEWVWGPEDVVDEFYLLGIDFRQYLGEDGTVTITAEERRKELKASKENVNAIRDDVRGWQRDLAGY